MKSQTKWTWYQPTDRPMNHLTKKKAQIRIYTYIETFMYFLYADKWQKDYSINGLGQYWWLLC